MNNGVPDDQRLRGKVERLLPGGYALVRSASGVILVRNAVPGDEIEIRPLAKRRGVQHGEVMNVLSPSAMRTLPTCPVAEACGGCALQFLKAEYHPAIKSAWVRDAFHDLIHDGESEWLPIDTEPMHPRRRVRWHVGRDRDGFFLGFFAPVSHRTVRQKHCPVLTRPLQILHDLLEELDLTHIDQVQAVQLSDGVHVVFASSFPFRGGLHVPDKVADLPLQAWWRKDGLSHPLTRPAKRMHDLLPAGEGKTVALEIGPESFVQGQFEGNRAMVAQIQAWAGKPRRIADLFCGVGNLSLPLAAATGASVYGADLSRASINAARRNARLLGVDGHFEVVDLFRDFDASPYVGADVMIMDGPRRGAKRICDNIQRLMPRKIIMASCDIASGARDGALLARHHYRLKALRALDMFPYTGHVETISLWEPA